LAALDADRRAAGAVLADLGNIPGSERPFWRRNLRKKLDFLDRIEAEIRVGFDDEEAPASEVA
jgi:hypothetical protein